MRADADDADVCGVRALVMLRLWWFYTQRQLPLLDLPGSDLLQGHPLCCSYPGVPLRSASRVLKSWLEQCYVPYVDVSLRLRLILELGMCRHSFRASMAVFLAGKLSPDKVARLGGWCSRRCSRTLTCGVRARL